MVRNKVIFCVLFILVVFISFIVAEQSSNIVLEGNVGDELEESVLVSVSDRMGGPITVSMFALDKEYQYKFRIYYDIEFDEKKEFILEPGEKKRVGFTITPREVGTWEIEIKAYTSPYGWGAGAGQPTYAVVTLNVKENEELVGQQVYKEIEKLDESVQGEEKLAQDKNNVIYLENTGEDNSEIIHLGSKPPKHTSSGFFKRIINWFLSLFS